METTLLDCLQAGEAGQIAWVDGPAEFITRLAEMGLRPGAAIRMIQPGRPCIIALNGHRLSLRVDGETQVFVELAGAGAVSV